MIFDLLNFELGRFRSRKKVFEKNFFFWSGERNSSKEELVCVRLISISRKVLITVS